MIEIIHEENYGHSELEVEIPERQERYLISLNISST